VGGLERVVEALARGQGAAGHTVLVAAVIGREERDHPFVRALQAAGVDVETLALSGRAYLRERAAVRALCRRRRPTVVHTHGYRPDVVDAGVARDCGIPVVTTVHGFTGTDWKNRFYERLQRRVYRRFDAVVAVSRPIAEWLARDGVPPARIHLVPNAWAPGAAALSRADARRALGVPEAGCQIGWVGRFSPEKGPDVMVQALARLADLPVTAVMVGVGSQLASVRAEAASLGVAARIVWPGIVPDAAGLFPAFDVFVLSSRTEGTPIVLFEAMAAGVPVVATRVGGVPDVVGDAEAVLVPSDDPQALAAAIRGVVENPKQAGARAAEARRRLAAQFSEGPWLARYEAVYRGVQRGAEAR
jgi:glycosyltransferase involved in cell wall biosynthesis